jgi:hypothetical protein
MRCRAERHPVSRPASQGEQAEIAIKVGPRRWAWATREAHAARGPACTFTCRAAVEFIIASPGRARPVATKCSSIA